MNVIIIYECIIGEKLGTPILKVQNISLLYNYIIARFLFCKLFFFSFLVQGKYFFW